jgi:hypothetical protein
LEEPDAFRPQTGFSAAAAAAAVAAVSAAAGGAGATGGGGGGDASAAGGGGGGGGLASVPPSPVAPRAVLPIARFLETVLSELRCGGGNATRAPLRLVSALHPLICFHARTLRYPHAPSPPPRPLPSSPLAPLCAARSSAAGALPPFASAFLAMAQRILDRLLAAFAVSP